MKSVVFAALLCGLPPLPAVSSPLSHKAIHQIIAKPCHKLRVDCNLVAAVIEVESSRKPNAVSHDGALGLMQLLPRTATFLGVHNPFNPLQNVAGGTKYLQYLLRHYHHNVSLALAAYNQGPSVVDRIHRVPAAARHYVEKVMIAYKRLQ